ncbi:MAG: hypothetical protein LKM41_10625 [Lachnospiraceae bacterium]|nr:hypothetical protein [Lachnospiraceae bacterium]
MTGLGKSCPSTAFPCPAAIADSWDPENAERMGKAIGEECAAYGVDVLLGPGTQPEEGSALRTEFRIFFRGSPAVRKDGGFLYPGNPGIRNGCMPQALCLE